MAIQHRRGVYNDFDPSRLLPGEWAVVLSNAPGATNGSAAYICFSPGKVKRVATVEDMATIIANAEPEAAAVITAAADAAEKTRTAAEALRVSAEKARAQAESGRASSEAARVSAERARANRQSANDAAQAKNNADQTANNAAAQGLVVKKLTSGQYDAGTYTPTVTGNAGHMYLVPDHKSDGDAFVEWVYIDGAWEAIGNTKAIPDAITTDAMDSIVAGTTQNGTSVMSLTGLSYWWTKLKARFAAVSHAHSASEITSGTLNVARVPNLDASKVSSGTLAAARIPGINASKVTSGILPVARGGTGKSNEYDAELSTGIRLSARCGVAVLSMNKEITPTGAYEWSVTQIATIPDGYRPRHQVTVPASRQTQSADDNWKVNPVLSVDVDGKVSILAWGLSLPQSKAFYAGQAVWMY